MSALRNAITLALQADSGVTSLATGGIHPHVAPEGAECPYVIVIAQQAPQPERVFQGIAFEDAIYLVKAVDKNPSPETVGQINAAIRAALDGAEISVEGYELITLIWRGDLSYFEEYDGQVYQHEGGFYQIWASKT